MQPADDQASGGGVVMLHWNVHSWRDESGQPNVGAVADLIADRRPDVVSLVEVNEPWAAPATVPALARQAGYSWIFCPAVVLGTDGPARGYGNAVLSRRPVLAVQQCQLTWPPKTYDGTEPSESRTVVLVRVSLPAGPVWAGSTHLPSTDRQDRTAAIGRLAAVALALEEPWLICGDFNTPAADWWAPGRQRITVSPDPAQPTFPAGAPTLPIDYCIGSPDLSLEAVALPTAGSDHLPVLVRGRRRTGRPEGHRAPSTSLRVRPGRFAGPGERLRVRARPRARKPADTAD
jgi:endonuclease/exonuclease/phosphatase family metal-dependent hydrolase